MPLTYFNDCGGGGGGGSEILAKSNFFQSIKDAGLFGVLEKKQRDFLGYAKKRSDFFFG